ncbi:MAG: exosortase/archaeosortase family protein [Verrucomicrobia bacterium]|nr:exosortase/archaeosortase family protein [Verrucomicrobiota bacterium]
MWQLERLPRWTVAGAVFGGLWCMLIERLAQYWVVEPEYSFGWLVPVLCGYLFWLRWGSRPAPGAPNVGLARCAFWVTALGLLPIWLIVQANPDWSVVAWLLAGQTVILSLCMIYWCGGTVWLRHFGFSICLILAAVPWPTFLESGAVHALTRLSTLVTAGGLNLLGIPALQHGNVIELRTGSVGLDEACSGIRSLQAVLMLTLFLGELYRSSFRRRYALVVIGAVIAFVFNSVRTICLTIVAAEQGSESVATWHDPIGYAAITACFLGVLAAGRLISGRLATLPAAIKTRPAHYPYRTLVGFGGWILFVFVGTEIWYRAHAPVQTTKWSFSWPVHKAEFADIPVTKAEADALLFDQGRGAVWTNGDGSHWVAYFFRWAEGPGWSRILARGHRPEVCFPAAGYKADRDYGMISVQVKGLSIPFHALDFQDGEDKEYVFFCVWEDGLKGLQRPRSPDRWGQLTRLRSVLLGERGLAQQTLEIVISGYENQAEAETAFRREIANLIEIGPDNLVAAASHR